METNLLNLAFDFFQLISIVLSVFSVTFNPFMHNVEKMYFNSQDFKIMFGYFSALYVKGLKNNFAEINNSTFKISEKSR